MGDPTGQSVVTDKKLQGTEGLPWVFLDKLVTVWAGLRLIKEVLDRMVMKEVSVGNGIPQPQSNRGYNPVVMMELFFWFNRKIKLITLENRYKIGFIAPISKRS
ncbi:MAG: hypothetical protein IPN90_09970 [Elusimicrobia bacterium]|nr:hypothetical protein [Elusimicrobiota bacterium]